MSKVQINDNVVVSDSDGPGQFDEDEKLFCIQFTRNGDSIGINTKFQKEISGVEFLTTMASATRYMVQTIGELGKQAGLTDEKILDLIFKDE